MPSWSELGKFYIAALVHQATLQLVSMNYEIIVEVCSLASLTLETVCCLRSSQDNSYHVELGSLQTIARLTRQELQNKDLQ